MWQFSKVRRQASKKKNTFSPALTQESSKLSGSRRTEIEFLGFHVPWWKVARLDCPLRVPLEPGTYVTTQPACLLSQTPPPALSPPVRLGMCISGDEWLPGGDLLLALNSGPPRIFHSAPLYLIWHFLQRPPPPQRMLGETDNGLRVRGLPHPPWSLFTAALLLAALGIECLFHFLFKVRKSPKFKKIKQGVWEGWTGSLRWANPNYIESG